MRQKVALIIPLLFCFFFVSGCKNSKEVVVYNTRISELSSIIREFAGLNGFQVVYASEGETRASYRVYMGTSTSFIPAEQETIVENNNYGYVIRNKADDAQTLNHQDLTRTSVRTVARPARTIITDYNYTLRLQKINGDVAIIAQSSGGSEARKYMNKFIKELEFRGIAYAVVK